MVDKNRRIIWSNEDYDEWEKCMREDGYDEEEITYERYMFEREVYLSDERSNLNIEVDGVIVIFAVLGLWDGKHNGAKIVRGGNNIKNILCDNNDYQTWYCDRYNVRCESTHHDGTNQYLYRLAKNMETAKKLVNQIAYEGMTEEEFRKKTKSIRPQVAKVYGW